MSKKESKNRVIRTFGMTTWAVDNRTTVFFLTGIIFLMGYFGYKGLPKESFPEVALPTIYIGTAYPGNSPDNIEKLITDKIEKEVGTLSGIKKMQSTSIQDFSTIIVEFESTILASDALRETKDAVDKAKSELPSDLDRDPLVDDINFGEFPIMYINMSGNYDMHTLKTYAELLEDKIEQIGEISEVHIRGVEDKEVKIFVDKHKLQAMELSFNDIAQAIDKRNADISGGELKVENTQRQMMFNGLIKDVKEFKNIIIKQERGYVIRLRDVLADGKEVVLEEKEKESFARFHEKKVVQLEVIKGSGKNLLAASDNINAIIKEVKEKKLVPEDLELTITLDQSSQTRSQVANLENSIISGVILVVLILLFFLGSRNSLFVGMAIPMSMFLSYMIFSFMGITINMMVLFGLIMALGMLVDNGIVVVENIYRLMDEGLSPIQAAKEGVGEVAWPIISSTGTTLAAFLPLAMWPGMMGEFMKFLPITLIIVLASSLFVALVINPAFAAVFMTTNEQGEKKKSNKRMFIAVGILVLFGLLMHSAFGNLLIVIAVLLLLDTFVLSKASNGFQNVFLPKLENGYEKFLIFALKGKRPILFVAGIIVMFVATMMIFSAFPPQVKFFPDNYPKYVNIFIEKPLYTGIEPTQEFALKVEDDVKKILANKTKNGVKYEEIVKALSTSVGKGTSDPGDPMATGGNTATPYKARLNIEFVDFEFRKGINSQEILNLLRDTIPYLVNTQKRYLNDRDAVITVDKDRAGPPVGKPVNIEITGHDYKKLIDYSEEIIALIRNSDVEGYDELKSDLDKGKLETEWKINYKLAQYLGVNTSDVAMTIRNSLYGMETGSKFKLEGDDYPIMIRLDDKYRYNMEELLNQPVTFRSQADGQIKQIPINAITTRNDKYSFASIKHKDEERVVTVYSNIADGYNDNEVVNKLKELLKDHELEEGYSFKFTGQQEEQAKEMSFLGMALLTALFLILLIIVAQFNKISAPIIILSSVLLSTIGVFLGLIIFDLDFIVIMTMIGIISLAGVVVNNAIVLLDYAALLKQRKIEEEFDGDATKFGKKELVETIVQTGKTRLRPVLLTAITTVLGLIPLAVGMNIDFYGLMESFSPNIYFGGDNVIFWRPMCMTIIFGIIFATFLTLIIVPVMYLGVERLKYRLYGKKRKAKAENNQGVESSLA